MAIRNDWGAKVSRKEIAAHVIAHFEEQGKRATTPDGRNCVYKGEAGEACAAGCLLTEGEQVEVQKVSSVFSEGGMSWLGLKDRGFTPARLAEHCDLICNLQKRHDAPEHFGGEVGSLIPLREYCAAILAEESPTP
jgi:hypothetical protein